MFPFLLVVFRFITANLFIALQFSPSFVFYHTTKPFLSERQVLRVGRVLSFSPVVGIGTPPPPHQQASVPHPTPMVLGGGAHSLGRGGVGESQFRRGDIHFVVRWYKMV
jgi:hypothetical protein